MGFGTLSIAISLAARHGTGLVPMMFWRYTLAVPLLVVLAGGWRRVALPRADAWRLVWLGGLGQAAVTLTSLSALRWISAATLGFLFYTFPAWVAVFAVARGQEKVSPWMVGCLALSLTGIAAMVGSPWSDAPHPVGVALALGAAVLYALYIPVLGRLRGGHPPGAASLHVFVGAGALFGLVAVAQRTPLAPIPLPAFGLAALLAVVSTALAFHAFLRGLAVLGPVRTSIVSTAEPFYTALAAALVLDQPLTPAVLVGGALIATAVVALQFPPRRAATA
jgi:drug/metabolite transporter (DMT)-like permease